MLGSHGEFYDSLHMERIGSEESISMVGVALLSFQLQYTATNCKNSAVNLSWSAHSLTPFLGWHSP